MNKINILICLTYFVFLINPLSSVAAPASKEIRTEILPDNSSLSYYVAGDEMCHYILSEDNYVLFKREDGFFVYGQQDENGYLLPGEMIAHNGLDRTTEEILYLKSITPFLEYHPEQTANYVEERGFRNAETPAGFSISAANSNPDAGRHTRNLVILVEFTNKQFAVQNPVEKFSQLLNQENYNGTGSAKDYFMMSSNGAYQPVFDVVGPFTLANEISHYAKEDNRRAYQMVIEACALADPTVDFSLYDADGDGKVDNICIIYAGNNAAEGKVGTVWPHCSNLTYNNIPTHDSKRIVSYMCTSELRSTGETADYMCGIGTFCHEFSHLLGLPDMYHKNEYFCLDEWDIMDSGFYSNKGQSPPVYSSYERYFMGWLTPEFIDQPRYYYLSDLKESNKAYIICNSLPNYNGFNPTPNEFFLLENRQQTGFDIALPGHGLLIWHINYNASAWVNNEPNDPNEKRIYVVPADGIHSKQTKKGDSFPGTSGNREYEPVLWDGTDLEKPIRKIAEVNGVISFEYMGGAVDMPSINFEHIKVWTQNQFITISGVPENTTVEIWQVDGKLISQQTVNDEITEIYVPQKGIYVVKLYSVNETVTLKVII